MPAAARPSENPTRSGECMSLPAPCATTTAAAAPSGHDQAPSTGPRAVSISMRSSTWCETRGRERDALPGDLWLRVRGVEGTVLSREPEGPRDAPFLLGSVPF